MVIARCRLRVKRVVEPTCFELALALVRESHAVECVFFAYFS